jgi:hypothetical protein
VNNSFINAFSHLWYNIDFITPTLGFFKPSYDSSAKHTIFKTTNGGVEWQELDQVHGWVNCLKFYSEHYGLVHMYSCEEIASYIMKTTNGGISWDSIPMNFSDNDDGVDIEFVKNDPSKVWLITGDTLRFSQDSGKTWIADPLTEQLDWRNRDIVIADGKVCWFLASTVYRNLNADQITSVSEESHLLSSQSINFTLYQNYPNPYNPTTNINFDVLEKARACLKVYDILGTEIRTIFEEEVLPGNYSVPFNGAGLSTGIYIYSLQIGDNRAAKNMILLK